jgi:hypothetical protein
MRLIRAFLIVLTFVAPALSQERQPISAAVVTNIISAFESKIALDPLTLAGLTNQWYYNPNTAFVSTKGADATAVLGDVTHPSLTFTNAYRLLPQMGGAAWFLGGSFSDAGLNVQKDMTVVAINSTYVAPALTLVSNFVWIGGELDSVFKPSGTVGVQTYSLQNVKMFPNSGMVNVDCVFGGGSVWASKCIFNGIFDAFTPNGSLEATINDSLVHIDASANPVNPARAISLAGFSGSFSAAVKNSTLIAFGSTAYNVGFTATRAGSACLLDNVNIYVGTNTISTNIFLSGAGVTCILKNMPLKGNVAAINGASIVPQSLPGSDTFNSLSLLAPLVLQTNIIQTPVANAGYFYVSNLADLYWVTTAKTNLIQLGH